MAKYTIAVKNDSTVKHDEMTGKLTKGWQRVYAWACLREVERFYDGIVRSGQYKGYIVGVFISHNNDMVAWYDRPPRFAQDTRDKSEMEFKGLRGLINSRSSTDI